MHNITDTDYSYGYLADEETQNESDNGISHEFNMGMDSSSANSTWLQNNNENVIYAICDGVDDGKDTYGGNNTNIAVVLSILRNQSSSRDNFLRHYDYSDESVPNVLRSIPRHISIFPNKSRWWQRGQVRYGSQITNINEKIISKTFTGVEGPVEDKACAICLDDLTTDLISLNGCLHIYHKTCFVDYVINSKKSKIVCPLCNCISFAGRGPSPPGKMSWNVKKEVTLLSNGTLITTIEIKYKMESGTQLRWHPSPGKPYKGVYKKAFLPITSDYLFILKMLILAFLDGQTFRIEDSFGAKFGNTVWNGIEHKTNIDGGVEGGGFPDSNYKSRVLENILSKGVEYSNLN
ncbi:hypothetical protein MACK_003557 [Theileria orientalis]|uniref:RING-type E3 ubiquitin transferase n=1 Tax=Theileria orientalis TaxID=68886 RepID=A0A976XJY1_THEOR|nr:hypothetical protein MACK_003557 [Theileria orientalis]